MAETITSEHIKLTAQLLDARDQLQRLYGDRYEERIHPVRKDLKCLAEATKRSVMSIGQGAAAKAQSAGKDMAAWEIIAAVVDVAEGK